MYYKIIIFLAACILCIPQGVFASELYLGIGEPDPEGTRDIAVILKTTLPINALEGRVTVLKNGVVSDISEARSPVQFWIERPYLSDTKDTITFAGIIPGGFVGEAVLFHILTTSDPTRFTIDNASLRMLQNDGAGTPDHVLVKKSIPLPLQFVLTEVKDDTTAPLPFELTVATIPTEHGDTASLVVSTRDEESGIMRFEIAFSDKEVLPTDQSLVWVPVESGTLLTREQLQKYIYVKAIDRAGNVRMTSTPPQDSLSVLERYKNSIIFSILSIVLLLSGTLLFFYKRRMNALRNAQS